MPVDCENLAFLPVTFNEICMSYETIYEMSTATSYSKVAELQKLIDVDSYSLVQSLGEVDHKGYLSIFKVFATLGGPQHMLVAIFIALIRSHDKILRPGVFR